MLGLSCVTGHHSPPLGKPPNHRRILVWFPAGSSILSGKDKHARFRPTLTPLEFTLLLGFCNWRPNVISCAKKNSTQTQWQATVQGGKVQRICNKCRAQPQAGLGTSKYSHTHPVRTTGMQFKCSDHALSYPPAAVPPVMVTLQHSLQQNVTAGTIAPCHFGSYSF